MKCKQTDLHILGNAADMNSKGYHYLSNKDQNIADKLLRMIIQNSSLQQRDYMSFQKDKNSLSILYMYLMDKLHN